MLILLNHCTEFIKKGVKMVLDSERVSSHNTEEINTTNEKRENRSFADTLSRYKRKSLISIIITASGLAFALICSFIYKRPYLGFYLGCVFYILSIAVQIIFSVSGIKSLSAGEYDRVSLNINKRRLAKTAVKTVIINLVVLSFTAPIHILPSERYPQVYFSTFFTWGLFYALVAYAVCGLLWSYSGYIAVKRGIYELNAGEEKVYFYNIKLNCRIALILLIFLIITAGGQLLLNYVAERTSLYCKTFTSFEDFKAYIEAEEDLPYTGNEEADVRSIDIGSYHYEWKEINKNVALIIWNKDGDGLPVRLYSDEDIKNIISFKNFANGVFILLYSIEIITGIVVFKKKEIPLSV